MAESKRILLIVNDAPYGSERPYNAFRVAMKLAREHPEVGLDIYLIGDAVACAVGGQKTPDGYYNIERMLKAVLSGGASVKV